MSDLDKALDNIMRNFTGQDNAGVPRAAAATDVMTLMDFVRAHRSCQQPDLMGLEMAKEISDIIQIRQDKFDGESLETSVMVVLLNYGDGRRIAYCIAGDWQGPKSEMNVAPSGIPICPKCGQVATEDEHGWQLALVKDGSALSGDSPT